MLSSATRQQLLQQKRIRCLFEKKINKKVTSLLNTRQAHTLTTKHYKTQKRIQNNATTSKHKYNTGVIRNMTYIVRQSLDYYYDNYNDD